MVLQRAALCQADERMVEQVGEADLACPRERVIPCDHADQPVDRKGNELQSCCVDRIRDDADIGQPARDRLDDIGALSLLELDIGLRMVGKPGAEPIRQELADGSRIGEEPDACAQAPRVFAKFAAQVLHLAKNETGMMGKRVAGRRCRHASAPAQKKRHAAILLHAAQPFAGGRQGEIGRLRAMGDAARFDDGKKQAKVDQVETHDGDDNGKSAFGIAEASLRIIRIASWQRSIMFVGMNELSSYFVGAIAAAFFLAGVVKGVTGMGLPTVAMGALGGLLSPVAAANLLILPSLVTNVWQLLAGPAFGPLMRRLWPMMLAIGIGTMFGTSLLAGGDTVVSTAMLGVALMIYAGYTLVAPPFSVSTSAERWLSVPVGLMTGVITGCTGVFVMPAVPYLQALGLDKEDLIQALGLSFTVSTLALAAGLMWRGAFACDNLLLSALAIMPALAGMWAGQLIRRVISPARFRRWFLIGLVLLGAELALRPLF